MSNVTIGWTEYKSVRIDGRDFMDRNRRAFEDWRLDLEIENEPIDDSMIREWLIDFLENDSDQVEGFRYAETEDRYEFQVS